MFCSKCGALNNEDAKFCSKCGAPLAGTATSGASASTVTGGSANAAADDWEQTNRPWKIAVIVAIVVMIVAMAGVALLLA